MIWKHFRRTIDLVFPREIFPRQSYLQQSKNVIVGWCKASRIWQVSFNSMILRLHLLLRDPYNWARRCEFKFQPILFYFALMSLQKKKSIFLYLFIKYDIRLAFLPWARSRLGELKLWIHTLGVQFVANCDLLPGLSKSVDGCARGVMESGSKWEIEGPGSNSCLVYYIHFHT